jgi:hypothetical protein
MNLGPSSTRRLNEMLGVPSEQDVKRRPPQSMGPTLIIVSEPMRVAEDVVKNLYDPEGAGKPPPNGWLQRQRRRGLLAGAGVEDAGARLSKPQAEINGRACCMVLIGQLDRQLAMLQLPSTHTCSTCGTVYRIEMRVREARDHGR